MPTSPLPYPDTLIIVACHAIYLGPPSPPQLESSWLIEDFQRGEVPTFVAHIKAGIDALKHVHDEGGSAILAFSGGRTKRNRTGRSEGGSYLDAAMEMGLLEGSEGLKGMQGDWRGRLVSEEWACDSFQNILCSLCQWPKWRQDLRQRSNLASTSISELKIKADADTDEAGLMEWPKKLIIVSHGFKRKRFLELHLPALQWHRDIEYIGIDPPFDEERMKQIVAGDEERGYGAWKRDLYGRGAVLSGKRESRGWVGEYFARDVLEGEDWGEGGEGEVLRDFVRWVDGKGEEGKGEGEGKRFVHDLPWERREEGK